jgi:uncharacterized protein
MAGDTLEGHAAVWGTYAEIGRNLERLAPSAFDKALTENHDVRCLMNHDANRLLARTANGSLELSTDAAGLAFRATIPDTSYGRDLKELVDQGLLTGMSFGFVPGEDVWERTDDGRRVRVHTSLKTLLDVSPVTFPAYEGTDVALRAMSFTRPLIDRRSQMIFARQRARHQRYGGSK